MVKKEPARLDAWENLLDAAAEFHALVPGSILVGGTAAALHAGHRFSADADHIVDGLKERFATVLDTLDGHPDWNTARIHPGKLILGNFQGVETGLRQLIRSAPLETETVHVRGKPLCIPTLAEMIRIKGWLALTRLYDLCVRLRRATLLLNEINRKSSPPANR
jgi:hypothetical protein